MLHKVQVPQVLSKVKKTCDLRFYDSEYPSHEQMPRVFRVSFQECFIEKKRKVTILIDGKQVGDPLTDNKAVNDGYRYHDIFHLSYLAVLGWSACMRKLFLKKRKSNPDTDENEDGARATVAEEGAAQHAFMYASHHNFFEGYSSIERSYLENVKLGFESFEVRDKSLEDWERAILKGFEVFRQLRANAGGVVEVDMYAQELRYVSKPVCVEKQLMYAF